MGAAHRSSVFNRIDFPKRLPMRKKTLKQNNDTRRVTLVYGHLDSIVKNLTIL